MTQRTIGTCSICRDGPVRVPEAYYSVIPPTPTCAKCGAVQRAHGPVIDMEPAPTRITDRTTTTLEALRRYL